ncbi:hypothetical protein KZ829_24910 [Actinoplanes hulinensis]|uniref:Uncharacterized protein n=1 Tax=Actinoplanes hulinensis TaxID=1144547 RepID=A0ABS7B976_9ACTN|nr:hypothetical protein [Actinoplanes hulinensis]MBW6436989.1 hypothetical protein [Actinoplanes hulinensis]
MTTVERWVEVHRLAVAGREPAIARRLEQVLAPKWLLTSRFTDAANLARLTLTLGPDASAFYDPGWAESATGDLRQALSIQRENSNLDVVLASGGRLSEAVKLQRRAVALAEQVSRPDLDRLRALLAQIEQAARAQAEEAPS